MHIYWKSSVESEKNVFSFGKTSLIHILKSVRRFFCIIMLTKNLIFQQILEFFNLHSKVKSWSPIYTYKLKIFYPSELNFYFHLVDRSSMDMSLSKPFFASNCSFRFRKYKKIIFWPNNDQFLVPFNSYCSSPLSILWSHFLSESRKTCGGTKIVSSKKNKKRTFLPCYYSRVATVLQLQRVIRSKKFWDHKRYIHFFYQFLRWFEFRCQLIIPGDFWSKKSTFAFSIDVAYRFFSFRYLGLIKSSIQLCVKIIQK